MGGAFHGSAYAYCLAGYSRDGRSRLAICICGKLEIVTLIEMSYDLHCCKSVNQMSEVDVVVYEGWASVGVKIDWSHHIEICRTM